MEDIYSNYAGLSTHRLHQLKEADVLKRKKQRINFSQHVALTDHVRDIFMQTNKQQSLNKNEERSATKGGTSYKTLNTYAGVRSDAYNNRLNSTSSKKKISQHTNRSMHMSSIIHGTRYAQNGIEQEILHNESINIPKKNNLKQYFTPEQLNDAFYIKFQITEKKTGRTEIMTARRPGKASAEVNIANFDCYKTARERPHNSAKYQNKIEQGIMGLTPRFNEEKKHGRCINFSSLSPNMTERHIGAHNNWMCTLENAKHLKIFGKEKRKLDVPWSKNSYSVSDVITRNNHKNSQNSLNGRDNFEPNSKIGCNFVEKEAGKKCLEADIQQETFSNKSTSNYYK